MLHLVARSPVFRRYRQTEEPVIDTGRVVPDSRVEQYDVARIDRKIERAADVLAFRRRRHRPRFPTADLCLPH